MKLPTCNSCVDHATGERRQVVARIRTIKPEFFSHEILASKSAHARLLAIGLLTLADCEGRVRWVPMQVHSQVFPWEASVKIEVLLRELIDASYVIHYEVDGKRYVEIVNFKKHQRLSGKESAYESRLPSPPATDSKPNDFVGETRERNGKHPDASPGSSGNPLGTGEHRNIGTGEQGIESLTLPSLFSELVSYWNNTMKQNCRCTTKRQAAFAVRMKDGWFADNWRQAIDAAGESEFCRGINDKGWVADLEWFLKPDSADKLIEGKYKNSASNGAGRQRVDLTLGPDD